MSVWGNLVNHLVPELIRRYWPDKAKRNRTETLKALLNDPRFEHGRSLGELGRKTGMNESELKEHLAEIGGRGIKLGDDREGWQLPKTATKLGG